MSDNTLLVTGASGHLGQRVLHHLVETLSVPASHIIATTRQPERLSAWAGRGVTVRAADFNIPDTLVAAAEGADRMLLVSTDVLDQPGVRLVQHRAAIDAATRAGVRHVVYTSMPDPSASLVAFAPDHAGTEAALAASGLPGWTVLRNHWYFENLFLSLPSALATGKWYSAAGNGGIAHIARDDLALAAATALVQADGKQIHTLSGAQAHTTAEIAALASAVTGKPIEVVNVPLEALVQGMVAHGLPEPVARIFASFDANTAAGKFAEVTDDYRKLTGRAPQTLEDWLRHNGAALSAAAAG